MAPWSCSVLVLSLSLGLVNSLDDEASPLDPSAEHDEASPLDPSAELKRRFAFEISGTLRRSDAFGQAFSGLYMDAAAAAAYAEQIRQAASYFPLYGRSEEVDEAVAEAALQLLLSPSCRRDVGRVADGLADIFANFSVSSGHVGADVGPMQLQAYAGGFAGGVIWRLGRLRRTTDPLFRLQGAAAAFERLADSLSARVRNSALVLDLCRESGVDDRAAALLSGAVCGSSYLDFDLGLAEDVSRKMVSSYEAAIEAMPAQTSLETRMLIASSVVGQTLAANIVRRTGVTGDVEEMSRDVYKLVSLGITLGRLNLK